jgi:hypothetical protein
MGSVREWRESAEAKSGSSQRVVFERKEGREGELEPDGGFPLSPAVETAIRTHLDDQC